ncbi:hypothetical protein ABVT39_010064 [Epinephelus coioides]
MWKFVLTVCLLHQNQAVPLPWEHGSLQPFLQQQLDQSSPSPPPDVLQQTTSSSSSSSSSSSVSSESSQSSEETQQLREQQNLENTAVEQVDTSQESSELPQSPSNTTSSLWLNELILVGERAGERDRETETGDNSAESTESRHRALMLTIHDLLSAPRLDGHGVEAAAEAGEVITHMGGAEGEAGVTAGEVGGETADTGVAAVEEGGVRGEEIDAEFPRLMDDSTEAVDRHANHHGYHGNEAELELGL